MWESPTPEDGHEGKWHRELFLMTARRSAPYWGYNLGGRFYEQLDTDFDF